tara:strand:- start:157 stop:420 length:264 start_codon:yes stop_codon:yes gene_type:complete
MNEKQEALMLECIVDIKNSLHHLSDCTYTGMDGGVFFRLSGDPLNINIQGMEECATSLENISDNIDEFKEDAMPIRVKGYVGVDTSQ